MPQLFLKTKRSAFVYEPLGVIGIISPWNYPWSIPFGEVGLALMAGNGVVLKPASLTPLLGERIARVFEVAGVPAGLVRVVHGPGTGAALAESSVGKVFFTGSVETGRSVAEALRPAPEGLRARARRQGPDDRARRRAPRARDRRRGVGRVRQRRPDVLGDRAGVRGALGGGSLHRRCHRGGEAAARGRPDELGHRDRPDGVRRAARDRPRPGRRRGRRGRRCCTAAGRSMRRRGSTARSTRRRC